MSNWKQAIMEFLGSRIQSWHAHLCNWRLPRRARLLTVSLTVGSACLLSGCTTVNSTVGSIFSSGCMSDAIELHRNRTCALKAWFRREHNFCDQPYLSDFKDGFIDGYIAIAEGKPGCPPSVPPKRYWNWAYQTPEGKAQLAAWYAGYPYGVQAAKDDGLNSYNHINLGPNYDTNRQNQNWGGYYGSPSYVPNNFDGGMPMQGSGNGVIQPLDTVPGASILQDPSAQNFSNPPVGQFSDSNFSLVE